MGLINSPSCRSCGAEEETVHILCECEAQTCISGFHFLDPEDVKSLSLGTIWIFSRGIRLPSLDIRLWGTKDLSKGVGASGPKGLELNH